MSKTKIFAVKKKLQSTTDINTKQKLSIITYNNNDNNFYYKFLSLVLLIYVFI